MNRLRICLVLILAICMALVIVAWLSHLPSETVDEPGIEFKLAAKFDPDLARIEILRKCHQTKSPPLSGDWLEKFPEGGQTFSQYVKTCDQNPLHEKYHGIDLQPLGDFDETQQKMIHQTADFIERFFGVPVRNLDPIRLENVPDDARKIRDNFEQINTHWIVNEYLLPRRRPDAIATIGLVTQDLWTGRFSWVFGEAMPANRLGVWSMHRTGDPHDGDEAYRLSLLRIVKTGVHETGHILGMPHCGKYECGMNGTRSSEEQDRRWLEFCPQCQAKIWWTCGTDPIDRCRRLAEYSDIMAWKHETNLFRREEILLKENAQPR